MDTIYILNGRVFGNNIYEIDCVNDINIRLQSEQTGYPEYNKCLYSKHINSSHSKKILNSLKSKLYRYHMKENYYKCDFNVLQENIETAIKHVEEYMEYCENKGIKKPSRKCFAF